ncbi:MAG: hypothetical protein ACYTGA_12820, partial [Planctomycetota bacterium]
MMIWPKVPVVKNAGFISIIALLAVMSPVAAGAEIIAPAAAVANSKYGDSYGNDWGIASNLIDATRINDSNQLVPGAWYSGFIGDDTWDTQDNWVYIDLGAIYDLDEIRIWNYTETDTVNNLLGRCVKVSSLWIAADGAALPPTMTATGTDSAFTPAMGWTSIWAGDLNIGETTTDPVDPDQVFDASANTGIRYVGINIDSRYGEDPNTYPTPYTNNAPGLGYIQVTGDNPVPLPVSPVVAGVTIAEVSSENPLGLDRDADHTVDGSALSGDGSQGSMHGNSAEGTMWTSQGSYGADYDPYITYDLGGIYNVSAIRIWNWNHSGITYMDVADMEVFAGPTLTSMTSRGVFAVDQAPGTATYTGQDFTVNFTDVRYVRFDILSNHDGAVFGPTETGTNGGSDGRSLTGLSEVRFEGKSTRATNPDPYDGDKAVAATKVLSWTASGAYTPSAYEVYLGTNRYKVAAGDASVKVTASDADGDPANTQYVPALPLSDDKEYFWRVDPIVDGSPVAGETWSFTTELLPPD